MNFTEDQIQRYSRHIILQEIGGKGQKKLLDSKVLIIECGRLGSPIAFYLAAAGIGKLGLVDSDNVELSNLQRQILHFSSDVGVPKTKSAKEKVELLNPDVKVETYNFRITKDNIFDIIKGYDIVVDGSDNFPTRYLVNDACVLMGKPLSHGAILQFYGQVTTIIPKKSACYRCLFKEPPPAGAVPSCQEAGVLGVVAGVIGAIQATEVIKWILQKGELLLNKLLIYDALDMEFRKVSFQKDNNCLVCGKNPNIKELIAYEDVCSIQRS